MGPAPPIFPENVPGRYAVDERCIDCHFCRETAPASFRIREGAGYCYVFRQPQGPEEEQGCDFAMEGCPVAAIRRGEPD